MTAAWTVRDRNGELLADFAAGSPMEVGRKIVGQHYDAFRLHVSQSYRELFERAVQVVLAREQWQIVRVTSRRSVRRPADLPRMAA